MSGRLEYCNSQTSLDTALPSGGIHMDIIACGSRPSRRMSAPSFTGTVWQDPIIQAPDPARPARNAPKLIECARDPALE